MNENLEAELPGKKVTPEELQMIYTRYFSVKRFIKDKEVLEVGCGPGIGLGYLAHYAKRVIGGDYSASNVLIAQKYYGKRIDIQTLDAHNLPFEKESFDVIIAMEVLLYLDVTKFLSECNRVLRRNGMLIVCLPNKDRIGFAPSKLSKNYFSIPELTAIFQNFSFSSKIYGAFKVRIGTTDAKPWNKSMKNKVISIIGKILRIVPGGKKIKNAIAQKFFKKIPIPPEIAEGMIEPYELVALDPHIVNHDYKIIYIFAIKGELS